MDDFGYVRTSQTDDLERNEEEDDNYGGFGFNANPPDGGDIPEPEVAVEVEVKGFDDEPKHRKPGAEHPSLPVIVPGRFSIDAPTEDEDKDKDKGKRCLGEINEKNSIAMAIMASIVLDVLVLIIFIVLPLGTETGSFMFIECFILIQFCFKYPLCSAYSYNPLLYRRLSLTQCLSFAFIGLYLNFYAGVESYIPEGWGFWERNLPLIILMGVFQIHFYGQILFAPAWKQSDPDDKPLCLTCDCGGFVDVLSMVFVVFSGIIFMLSVLLSMANSALVGNSQDLQFIVYYLTCSYCFKHFLNQMIHVEYCKKYTGDARTTPKVQLSLIVQITCVCMICFLIFCILIVYSCQSLAKFQQFIDSHHAVIWTPLNYCLKWVCSNIFNKIERFYLSAINVVLGILCESVYWGFFVYYLSLETVWDFPRACKGKTNDLELTSI